MRSFHPAAGAARFPSRPRRVQLASLAAALLMAACTPGEGEVPVDEPPIDPASAAPGGPVPAPVVATPDDVNPGLPLSAGSETGTTVAVSTQAASEPYLIDGNGSALYTMVDDPDGRGCTDACLQVWPPLLVEDGRPALGPRLQAAEAGMVQRPDGSRQVTYRGHPLYRHAADATRGPTAGHGMQDEWGEWYLVGPQGELLPESQVESTDTEL